MAVDSRDKRFSMIHMGNPTRPTFLADGFVGSNDMYSLLGLYHGISLDDPVIDEGTGRHGGMMVNPTRGMDP